MPYLNCFKQFEKQMLATRGRDKQGRRIGASQHNMADRSALKALGLNSEYLGSLLVDGSQDRHSAALLVAFGCQHHRERPPDDDDDDDTSYVIDADPNLAFTLLSSATYNSVRAHFAHTLPSHYCRSAETPNTINGVARLPTKNNVPAGHDNIRQC